MVGAMRTPQPTVPEPTPKSNPYDGVMALIEDTSPMIQRSILVFLRQIDDKGTTVSELEGLLKLNKTGEVVAG